MIKISETNKKQNNSKESKNINYNNNEEDKQELKKFILSIFGNDEATGHRYVEKIIDDEGFDNIKVFCSLTSNDLKEIGVEKMGHRKKIMQQIQEYS